MAFRETRSMRRSCRDSRGRFATCYREHASGHSFSSLVQVLRLEYPQHADGMIARMQNGASLEDAFYSAFGSGKYRRKLNEFASMYPVLGMRWGA